jgi:hypothetical protein
MAENLGVVMEWDLAAVHQFMDSPEGELGRTLMRALGEAVLADARQRAEVRTGKMRSEMTVEVGADEESVYADVISPARSAAGFPYPYVHEGRKIRDRRPHRSLVPALDALRRL